MTEIRVTPGGTVQAASGGGAIGATGLTIGPAAGKRWKLISSVADLTASATVGNRILQARINYPGPVPLWVGAASGNIAASQVGGYDIHFGTPGAVSTTVRRNLANTANTNVQVREFSSEIWLLPNWTLALDDSANIDNADVLTWYVTYEEYDA